MASKRALLVYNVCGIKKDNTSKYPLFLQAIRNQVEKFNGEAKVVVSGCLMRESTLPLLKSIFPEFDFIHILETLPVNVTFNKAVDYAVEKYGKFDTYTYIAADALLGHPSNVLNEMTDVFVNNPEVGMYSAQIDHDSCYAFGLKLGGGRHLIDDERAREEMFADGKDYIVPVGRACAAHFNMYSSAVFDFYGRCCPDIFASYCTESVFTFMLAAIKKQWWISKDHMIQHFASMDGPSCGFKPGEERRPDGYWDHPLFGDTLMPIFENERALSLGLGYEECTGAVMHDDSQFDDNYFCINDELKHYIKDNLFLNKNQLNYDSIRYSVI